MYIALYAVLQYTILHKVSWATAQYTIDFNTVCPARNDSYTA